MSVFVVTISPSHATELVEGDKVSADASGVLTISKVEDPSYSIVTYKAVAIYKSTAWVSVRMLGADDVSKISRQEKTDLAYTPIDWGYDGVEDAGLERMGTETCPER